MGGPHTQKELKAQLSPRVKGRKTEVSLHSCTNHAFIPATGFVNSAPTEHLNGQPGLPQSWERNFSSCSLGGDVY